MQQFNVISRTAFLQRRLRENLHEERKRIKTKCLSRQWRRRAHKVRISYGET